MKTNTNTVNISVQLQEHLNKYDINDRDFIKMLALIDQYVHQKQEEYIKSVFRSRAKSNPDMTFAEYWERQYNQKHDYRGAELQASLNTEGGK